jgi:hypothetical protein
VPRTRWTSDRLAAAGLLRVGVGLGLLARPSVLPQAMGVDSSTAARIGWLVQMAGARDAAIGAGLVHAARTRRDPVPWVLAGAVCDAVDAVAFALAAARGRVRPALGAAAAASGVAGAVSHLDACRELTAQRS